MLRTFRCKDTEALFSRNRRPRFRNIESLARRKLVMLNSAESLQDLRAVPGNRLEQLYGDRLGWHSIRINDQWRLCLIWRGRDGYDVEIDDYH